MTRPANLLAASCAPFLLLAACGGSTQRPNVLLVTLDTTRPDYMGTYGYAGGADHTPNFDALAEEGVRFDMAISASAVTPVSHATILTGTFPYTHGLRVLSAPSGFRLPEDTPVLSTIFKEEGYATGAIHSAFPVSSYFGFDRDFDFFNSLEGAMEKKNDNSGWDTTNLQRRSDDTTDIALDWIGAQEEPFFLWIHYWDPHDPLKLPPDEVVGEALLAEKAAAEADRSRQPDPTLRDRIYANEVHYLDSQFGRLLDGMRSTGVYDSTVIAVTADHGEGLSDGLERHRWPSHRMVYQEQIRVPLIVRVPEGTRRKIPQVVRTADIAPTLLDYAGLDVPEIFDGASLRPLIEGRDATSRVAYADQLNGYDANASMTQFRPDAKFLFCVIDGPWKLTYRPHMPQSSELFHLEEDPLETRNRIADEPDVVRRLLADLARRDPWVLAPFVDDGSADPSAVAMLEGLGYTGGGDTELVDEPEWRWTCPEHMQLRLAEPGEHDCGRTLIPIADDQGN